MSEIKEEFWSSGKLKSRGAYEDGKREGVFEYWFRNGELDVCETYQNGILVS